MAVEDKTNASLLTRITVRPDVFGGKPIVRDMRISVELVLSLLDTGSDASGYYGGLPRPGSG